MTVDVSQLGYNTPFLLGEDERLKKLSWAFSI